MASAAELRAKEQAKPPSGKSLTPAPLTPEEEYLQSLSPTEALKFRKQLENRRVYSPAEASANLAQTGKDLLYATPVVGNVMSAMDVPGYASDVARYSRENNTPEARKAMMAAELSALGAIPFLPFGGTSRAATNGAALRTNIFAGPMAKTADHAALENAKRLAQSGATRDEIWNQTGWFAGNDGKWRFEIDDSKAALAGLGKGKVARFSGIDHSDLEAAYGRLAPVHGFVKPGIREDGSYLPATRNVPPYLHAYGPNPEAAKGVTLHEFQHAAQDVEGFAPGANYTAQNKGHDKAAYDIYNRTAGEVEARNVQTRMNMTPAERRAKAPWLTQDVPDEQQIVRSR